jgi:hypothetical protein
MAKSHTDDKATPEAGRDRTRPRQDKAATGQGRDGVGVGQGTAERAPRPGSNPPAVPASQVSAKADAERAIAADRANGTGQKAAPDSKPLYAVKGETILDANGNPLATCDTEQAAIADRSHPERVGGTYRLCSPERDGRTGRP